jgi:hypothetical protein
MPADDHVEIALNDGPTPLTYNLTPGSAFQPETVQATFDGSGTAIPFLPCCTLLGPDGRKLSRTFPASAMAAGDVSGVTFAPF